MRVGTKSQQRMSIGRKIFKTIFPKDRSKVKSEDIAFEKLVGEEEAMFRFASKNNEAYITFNENTAMTYSKDKEE